MRPALLAALGVVCKTWMHGLNTTTVHGADRLDTALQQRQHGQGLVRIAPAGRWSEWLQRSRLMGRSHASLTSHPSVAWHSDGALQTAARTKPVVCSLYTTQLCAQSLAEPPEAMVGLSTAHTLTHSIPPVAVRGAAQAHAPTDGAAACVCS